MEDMKNCFNVETMCSDACLCASCRRNFTRWRCSCDEEKKKYFVKAQCRGKTFVNKITLAQPDRRLAVTNITKTKTAPISLLLCLLEVVLLDTFRYVGIADIFNLRLTYQYVNIICTASLHWLPVSAHIDFKILLLVFKVLNGLGPLYLSELLEPYIPNRNLRSAKKKLLVVPKYNLKTYGYRAFSHRAPTLWNTLSHDIRQVDLLETFKSKLKTHLFRQFFY